MHYPKLIAVVIFSMISAAIPAFCAEIVMEKSLPAVACAEGWTMDGKVTLFDKNTLFDRINGESELYFPYGFEKLAYARYENKQDPKIAVDADVYKMGSLLDAFGMFANYRRKDDADIAVGVQGTISSSQVFFYQDRYFVRLQVTGATSIAQEVFLACAKAISQNLPKSADRPEELDAFAVPAVVKRSERYVAQSLLGYDFFRRGLIADALLNNEQVQVFVVTEQSGDAARKTFDQYRSYLKTSGSDALVTDGKGRTSLEAIDPLYGKVFVEQAGRFVIGAVRIKDGPAAKQLVEQLRKRMSKE
ncbi:MAG: hypothetical protein M0R70_05110 [Nitrospirae bacterium]|nr:hypothetical protein [Nitrospirota bacterium]